MAAINWSNVTDFAQFPALANQASDGGFWVGMYLMIWVILLLVSIGFGWEIAILVSSFGALVLGLLLTYAGLVNWYYVTIFPAIIILMILYLKWRQPKARQ